MRKTDHFYVTPFSCWCWARAAECCCCYELWSGWCKKFWQLFIVIYWSSVFFVMLSIWIQSHAHPINLISRHEDKTKHNLAETNDKQYFNYQKSPLPQIKTQSAKVDILVGAGWWLWFYFIHEDADTGHWATDRQTHRQTEFDPDIPWAWLETDADVCLSLHNVHRKPRSDALLQCLNPGDVSSSSINQQIKGVLFSVTCDG